MARVAHMQRDKLLMIGTDIALGGSPDRPITRWEAMFLPRELHDVVATTQIPDSVGTLRPLVRSEYVLFQARRPLAPVSPPSLVTPFFVIGLAIAAVFLLLGMRAANGGTVIRAATATLFAIWSLIVGLLGVVLTLLWTATDHVFAHQNENLLIFNPLWLALVFMLSLTFMFRRLVRATSFLTSTLATASTVALIAHLIRLSAQSNIAPVLLMLPPAVAIAVATRFRARGSETVRGVTQRP